MDITANYPTNKHQPPKPMTAKANTASIIRADMRRVNALLDHAYEFRQRLRDDLAFVESRIDALNLEKADLLEKFNRLEK